MVLAPTFLGDREGAPFMTIFAILMPEPQPLLAATIKEVFPADHYVVTETQWLISDSGTAIDLSKKLGIFDSVNPQKTTGNAIVLGVLSYHGRAPTPVWDWIRAKLEKP
jgi:hypothetical protein